MIYRMLACRSNLPGEQEQVERSFTRLGDAINYCEDYSLSWFLIFNIDEDTGKCYYITTYDAFDGGTFFTTDMEHMLKEELCWRENIRICEEFKADLGIKEWA